MKLKRNFLTTFMIQTFFFCCIAFLYRGEQKWENFVLLHSEATQEISRWKLIFDTFLYAYEQHKKKSVKNFLGLKKVKCWGLMINNRKCRNILTDLTLIEKFYLSFATPFDGNECEIIKKRFQRYKFTSPVENENFLFRYQKS